MAWKRGSIRASKEQRPYLSTFTTAMAEREREGFGVVRYLSLLDFAERARERRERFWRKEYIDMKLVRGGFGGPRATHLLLPSALVAKVFIYQVR